MLSLNQTTDNHQCYTLTGIPGMPEKDFWMALPLCLLYSTSVLGNVIILAVIKVEHSLHEPMYYFLAMLAAMDLCLSLDACITQMFFIHSFEEVELGVLVAPWPLIILWLFTSLCTMLLFSLMQSPATLGQQSYYGVSWQCSLCLSSSKGYLSAIPVSYIMHTAFIRMPGGLTCDTHVNSFYGLLAVIFIIVNK